MHTLIHCDACRQPMRLPPSYVGKKVQCPTCGVRFTARAEPEYVDVELVEQPESAAVELTESHAVKEPDVLWVEPAEAEAERRAGPLRLRKPPPTQAPKPGRWPVYLFVLAALPLGLPVLGGLATFNRPQDPTAAMLVWTGAAVVLTGLCLVIALPGRVSVGVRLAGSLTLSFVAYAVGVVVLLLGLTANEVASHEWQFVNPPAGQFRGSLPGIQIQHPHVGPALDGGVAARGHRYQGTSASSGVICCIDSFEVPANFNPDVFIQNCNADLKRDHPGDRVVNDRRIFAAGAVGREFTLRRSPNHHATVRYLATRQRLYVLSILSSAGPVGARTQDRFFNSFAIVQPPDLGVPKPPPQPQPQPPQPPRPPTDPPGPVVLGAPLGPLEAGGEVRALAFAPDGRTLAVAADGAGVDFWEVPALRLRNRANVSVQLLTTAAYSPDGGRLAVGGGPVPVTLLDSATGGKVQTFEPWAGQPVAGFAFSPDGKLLAAATSSPDKPIVRLWTLANGEGRDVLPFDNTKRDGLRYHGVAFTPDSKRLFVSGYRGNSGRPPERVDAFHEVKPGKEPRALSAYRTERFAKARLSPDGKTAAYYTKDGAVRLWDAENDREVATLGGHPGTVAEVAFSPDGATLASVSTEGTVKLWDVAARRERATFTIRGGGNATLGKLAFSADGRTLAAALGRKVSLWDVSRVTGKP